MRPTLEPGDRLLVVRGGPARVGDVVAVGDPRTPARTMLKRVAARGPAGVTVLGDNAAAGGGSDRHGAGTVHGRVVVRVRGRRVQRVRRTPNGPAA